jgi:alcohol dehydrogenase
VLTDAFEFQLRTRVVYGQGALARLGELGRELGFARTLLVADHGLVRCGIVERAVASLRAAGIEAVGFHEFGENPDTAMVERGTLTAREAGIDSLVGLGGGSSLDCAKGINFLLSGGGAMQDYWGFGKATKPMLPMIGVPTTAGTGSEAQSYALISDARTHVKMACGDPKAAFRVALLDPDLTLSLPRTVAAAAGYDALSHAVETFVSTRRTPLSVSFAREAWRLLEGNYERVLAESSDPGARGAMLLGAHCAGIAIENSMLGAAHACANPLTARHGTAHGVAIALMLPHVVRWNGDAAAALYRELLALAGREAGDPGEALASRLESLALAGGLPRGLRSAGVREEDLASLASEAAVQWTGRFNPRPFDEAGAHELYRRAMQA